MGLSSRISKLEGTLLPPRFFIYSEGRSKTACTRDEFLGMMIECLELDAHREIDEPWPADRPIKYQYLWPAFKDAVPGPGQGSIIQTLRDFVNEYQAEQANQT
jgi:hypothetical protein